MGIIEVLKVILIGIVEGVTEWLPISSTGHMLLLDEFIKLDVTAEFKKMFIVVIQLGAIMAVVVLFWKKMFPFELKRKEITFRKDIFSTWLKVIVGLIPTVVFGIFLEELFDKYLSTPYIIALALIVYGILFIIIENKNATRLVKTENLSDLTYKTALIIGMFQVLSIIPGTSRSGATIIGALIIGVSRVAAAEFTFFLAVPTMLGASVLKLAKFGLNFTTEEIGILLMGMIVAFVVSIVSIKFLMGYIKKNDFKFFGWYRIVLGVIVIAYFGLSALIK